VIVYLHGFRSSPRSFKAMLLARRMAELGLAAQWRCPQLPVSPLAAVATVTRLFDGADPADVTLIGSSLGGYYATWLAERYGCRAVLLNPAVDPARDLHRYLGEQALWHGGGSILVEARHLDELTALSVATVVDPTRYYLIAAKGDKVLDYREAVRKYEGASVTLIEGGDHGIGDFARYVDDVLRFCRVRPA
jgi:predicted esterase YcpF (UPF0227 family)